MRPKKNKKSHFESTMGLATSPFAFRNIRLFIAFRIFFNCRFYYPVFTILFLDYGLTLEQFALLNTVWAITIVLAEVPSGALADILGRKRLLLATSLFMVVELGIIAAVPLGNIHLIFWAFLINRVMSGLAEAMASGADEAIAYDTLAANGLAHCWPRVLSLQMRMKSVGSILTAALGAFVYDPEIINRLLIWTGSDTMISQQQTMRYPVYLTLLLALLATLTSLLFVEKNHSTREQTRVAFSDHLKGAMAMTLEAGRWILKTPFALAVIAVGVYFDHILRLIITLTSQYYRLIHLPEASFGLIAAAMSLLGLYMPKLCERLVDRYSARQNMLALLGVTIGSLIIMQGFYPYVGILAIVLVYIGLTMVSFFSSHYLNTITESSRRATILSFKGMAYNLGYGMIGILFAVIMQQMRARTSLSNPAWSETLIEQQSFMLSIGWLPWYTILLAGLLLLWLTLSRPDKSSGGKQMGNIP